MTTALYRRYRPEAFGEMIGQAQVTEPLMTALRSDRVGHAYLFSGPRGCGKTTSARILARCLNCAAGPTDTPCGECDSCIELGRGGSGSLDVVEIDAASHNGVDDARDLRERAIFAPARDRYKIFILDEAHMVTQQGFNALLKLVEEPPDHVKFIFATTEPEKVLGTIRSRTHHYPFRLVPPAAMLSYIQELCETEQVTVEPGVLPLVVRAGGGSPRDTLSLLDQLIAGSDGTVGYERAVALLGYTHAELLDAVVDAFGDADAAATFAAIDRVVQTGQDPRRFVDDLLERLRDLIIIAATGQGAAAVLRGVPADELERMSRQAAVFGSDRLSRTADIVVAALDEMTGATSPRLQLELMAARVLAHTGSRPPVVERAKRDDPSTSSGTVSPGLVAEPVAEPVAGPVAEPVGASTPAHGTPVTFPRMRDAWPEVLGELEGISRASWLVASNARVTALDGDVLTLSFQSQSDVASFKQRSAGAGPSEDLRTAIQRVLGLRVKYIAKHDSDTGEPPPGEPPPPDDAPPPEPPLDESRQPRPRATAKAAAGGPVTDWAVAAIPTHIPDAASTAPARVRAPEASRAAVLDDAPVAQFAVDEEPEAAADVRAAVATVVPREGEVLPDDIVEPSIEPDQDEVEAERLTSAETPAPPAVAPRPQAAAPGMQRYGEAVVRQVLGARFIREEPYEPPTRFS